MNCGHTLVIPVLFVYAIDRVPSKKLLSPEYVHQDKPDGALKASINHTRALKLITSISHLDVPKTISLNSTIESSP